MRRRAAILTGVAGGVDVRELYDEALAFSVRALMGHLVRTAERGLATAQHRPTTSIPHVVTDIPDEALATRYGVLAAHLHPAWSKVGPTDEVRAPWGPTTADAAVWGFATETLVHGWDLAVATDRVRRRIGLLDPVEDGITPVQLAPVCRSCESSGFGAKRRRHRNVVQLLVRSTFARWRPIAWGGNFRTFWKRWKRPRRSTLWTRLLAS